MLKKILKNIVKKPTDKLDVLYKQPKTEKNMASVQVFKEGLIQQADLLFVPNDCGYKYILIVIDNHSKICDAEKLKNKDAITITKAFEKIYSRGILKLPEDTIELDSGTEFHGATEKYFNDKNIRIRYALPNRHRAQSLIERRNQTFGTLIHRIQAHKELETGKPNKQWISILHVLVREINANLPKPITNAISDDPITNDYNKKLLSINDKVKIMLDHPISLDGKKLSGKFRSSDIRWSLKTYTIKEVLLRPGMPPQYLTSKTNEVAYSKEQLQPVSS